MQELGHFQPLVILLGRRLQTFLAKWNDDGSSAEDEFDLHGVPRISLRMVTKCQRARVNIEE